MRDLEIYSPVEEISSPLLTEKQIELFVKRDDMIHPFISGNKWRKLKYILKEATEKDQKHLVTFGGAYSNHLLATACAAAKFGFKSSGIVRGEEVSNQTLMLCSLFGMELIFTDRESYRHKEELFEKYFRQDPAAFFINEGGAGAAAVKGCSELTDELTYVYDHIFCAAGTGTTAAGILHGIERNELPTRMNVVPVLKGTDYLKDEIKSFSGSEEFNFYAEYHFGGYAKTEPALINFIKTFCSSTGILIEPVYTGKMFYAIYDLISKNQLKPGSKVLAVHTGGLSGIAGMAEKFA
ncbi:pyridoxal-phosphate dependent enzyme [Daejeonella sp. H1SJ63]|jgi:1-aminocyclopropane-1-carboxylate deaminase|uniref:1-aminocyclopropane-1-carboxylate deaminase/D-cysteine desulfhydrase n=1 Tax=Daejeonella sp. H1SJ63 TaxID=3034145 RepID=UPI0023EB7416|nr:pyridoxal-phosphate dependent enzyme [Daejeonella sp. H1SJ63]